MQYSKSFLEYAESNHVYLLLVKKKESHYLNQLEIVKFLDDVLNLYKVPKQNLPRNSLKLFKVAYSTHILFIAVVLYKKINYLLFEILKISHLTSGQQLKFANNNINKKNAI